MREKERELQEKYRAELTSLERRLQTAEEDLLTEREKRKLEEKKNRALREIMRYYESRMGNCRHEAESTPF
uniref:Uncharacterized protein n=1 Tax=Anguilla anguilla TaxID=7936 RepID=A0A0E9USX5_ANGAN